MNPQRFPLEPLAATLGINLGTTGRPPGTPGHLNGWHALANHTGLSVDQLRYRHTIGGLDEYEADRAAITAGHHPSHIWPTWFNNPDEHQLPDCAA